MAVIGADQDRPEGGRGVTQRRFKGLNVLREAAQEREHARVLLLARKIEDEEDRTRGLVRPIRSADVALQHAEQLRGDLLPVVERPLQDLVGQIVTGRAEGLDGGLKAQRDPPSLRKSGAAAGRHWSRRALERETSGAAASSDQAAV